MSFFPGGHLILASCVTCLVLRGPNFVIIFGNDVICYHWALKLAYFVKHNMLSALQVQPSVFSGSGMEPSVLTRTKKPSAFRVVWKSNECINIPVKRPNKEWRKTMAYRGLLSFRQAKMWKENLETRTFSQLCQNIFKKMNFIGPP